VGTKEGPLLALGCLGAVLLILAIILAAGSDDRILSGLGIIALGALFAAAARPLAEIFRHWSWPPLPWPVFVAFGIAIVVVGVSRVASA
jgi:hypothetical protein